MTPALLPRRRTRALDGHALGALAIAVVGALMLCGCNPRISRSHLAAAGALFEIDSIVPPDGADGVPRDARVEISLTRALDRSSIGPSVDALGDHIAIERVDTAVPAPVPGSWALDRADTRILFTPDAPLAVPQARYRISVAAGLRDVDGQDLDIAGSPVAVPSFFTTAAIDDVTPPVFGGITQLEVLSSSALRAAWDPASDDFATAGEIFYRVYRSDPPSSAEIDFSTPVVETAPGAIDALITGLQPDREYRVAVRAVDTFGNESGNVEELSATTLALPDVTPPVFAGIQELLAVGTTQLEARWQSASDDRSDAASIRYRVYLAPAGSPIDFGAPFRTTAFGVTSEILEPLASDTVYDVVVRAVDTADNESDNQTPLEERTLASFAADVFPILSTPTIGGCTRSFCHSLPNPAARLDLETWDGLIQGGVTRSPPAVVPGDASRSLIIWRIDESSPNFFRPRMPSGGAALSPGRIGTIRRWIDQGALDN